MTQFLLKYNHWFIQSRFLISASLLRIGLGIVILYMYLMHYAQRFYLWSNDGIISNDMLSLNLYTISDSNLFFDLIYHLGILFAFLFLLGYKTRLISIINYIFVFSLLERNGIIADGGDNLLRVCLFYLLFANMSAYFSIDASIKRARSKRIKNKSYERGSNVLHNFAVLMCIIQLCILYLTSGLYQVMGSMWNSGTAIYYILQVNEFTRDSLLNQILLKNDYLIVLFTYASILVKISFPFLLFNKKTKYFAMASIIFFHFGIGYSMGLITFSLIMILFELLLINDEEYVRFFAFVKKKINSLSKSLKRMGDSKILQPQKIVVFYDGWCPLCRKTIIMWGRLDTFGLLVFKSFRESEVIEEYKLDKNKVENRMHSIKVSNRRVVEGMDSFIQITKRIPLLWLFLIPMIVVNLIGLGQWSYDLIAKKRNIIPQGERGCNDQSCPVDRNGI